MDGLSELQLVNKAMEQRPAAEETQQPEEEELDMLKGLDLSSLSVEDRAAIQPLIDALAASANGGDGENLDELLKQMDAAEGVADDLDAKLDMLLENMRGLEAEKGEELAAAGDEGQQKEAAGVKSLDVETGTEKEKEISK